MRLLPNFWVSRINDTSALKAFAHFLVAQKQQLVVFGITRTRGLASTVKALLVVLFSSSWTLALGRMGVGVVFNGRASEKSSQKVNP